MENITLEKVDMIRERTNASYEVAKEALEACEGNVLDALIYIEKKQKESHEEYSFEKESNASVTIEELKTWLKDLIKKGNITRIKIKKDETELIDIPVNAGIAAGVIAIIIPPILAAGVIAAVATQITIEITKVDGSVEVVNKYVSKVTEDVKNKANDFADIIKSKVNEVKTEYKNEDKNEEDSFKKKFNSEENAGYSYTVTFDEDGNESTIKKETDDEVKKEAESDENK